MQTHLPDPTTLEAGLFAHAPPPERAVRVQSAVRSLLPTSVAARLSRGTEADEEDTIRIFGNLFGRRAGIRGAGGRKDDVPSAIISHADGSGSTWPGVSGLLLSLP